MSEIHDTENKKRLLNGLGRVALGVFLVGWPVALGVLWLQQSGPLFTDDNQAARQTTLVPPAAPRNPAEGQAVKTRNAPRVPATVTPDSVPSAAALRPAFDQEVYLKLQSTCRYWTARVRRGQQVIAMQNAACDRMRAYANSSGRTPPAIPNYSPAPRIRSVADTTSQRKITVSRTDSAKQKQRRRCEAVDARIDWIDSRLRAGYRVAEGERWKDELRQLKKERLSDCRGR